MMQISQRVLIGIFLATFVQNGSASNFVFDSNEINSIQYDVRIVGDPVVAKPGTDGPSVDKVAAMTMTNKFGQKYRCLIPVEGDTEAGEKSGSGLDEGEKEYNDVTDLTTENLQKLLAPMGQGPCLLGTKDWWSYEFCYGKEIRQYHIEDGKPSGAILILGIYEHDYDWSKENENKDQSRVRHHSQFYSNGSKCDLTGTLRKTEVRFECDPREVGDRITRVDEPQSCEYVITISTPKICTVKKLKPEDSPKPKEINCSPVFTQAQFQRYQEHVKTEQIREEKRRVAAAKKHKEEMLKLVEGEDLSGIDLDTKEGMVQLESMVGDKMADKLMLTINEFLQPQIPDEYEEVLLPSGEKKTVLKKARHDKDSEEDYNKLLDDVVGLLNKISAKHGENPQIQKTTEFLEYLKQDRAESSETENILDEAADDLGLDEKIKSDLFKTLSDDMKEVYEKLDSTEAEVSRINEEIEMKKKEIEELTQKEGTKSQEEVEIGIKTVPNVNVQGISNTDSERRVVKHLENAIKQKLSKAKLDVGGRSIEVKVITGSPLDLRDNDLEGYEESGDQKQIQGMIYNMMIGNQDGYDDIERQLTSEHNYKFDIDALKDSDELDDSSTEKEFDEVSSEEGPVEENVQEEDSHSKEEL